MKDEDFNNLTRKAFTWMENQKKGKGQKGDSRKEYLSEETVSDYLGSRLLASEMDKVADHLSHCSHCCRLVCTVVELEKTEEAESSSPIGT